MTAESEDYNWPFASFSPGVLAKFELPDCYRLWATKQLRLLEPWDARMGGSSMATGTGIIES